jgi:heat shock protein HslJ
MKKYLLVLAIVLSSVSCNSKKEVSTMSNQNINRVWMLVSFKNYTKEDLTQKNAFLDLTNPEHAAAKMGCNNLSFAIKVEKNKIHFSQGIATKMYCQNMNLENDFSKEISTITNFKVEGHKLILISSKGEKMEFIAQDWD